MQILNLKERETYSLLRTLLCDEIGGTMKTGTPRASLKRPKKTTNAQLQLLDSRKIFPHT